MDCTQHDGTGFNFNFGHTWIYPTNMPIRKYQKDIVQAALFKNTMVCLPTGLGKTFIAAVVMYNFFRWYPSGKIIFMATTKPLVKQQVDACYNIVAIPKDATAELTGNVVKQNRQQIWEERRVFFVTPQVLQNDLETVIGLGQKIRCIVIDEAHRARGNHAFCEVINKLMQLNPHFRVLALTATPASHVIDVINICKQLLISHLEVRTEESPDVIPYLHKKTIETVVLKLDGKLGEVIEEYKNILNTYVKILVENNVIHSNFSALHKGRLFYLSKEYQEKNKHNTNNSTYKLVAKVFAICTILYHAYDLLLRHGMRSFAKFMEENINKPLLTESSSNIQLIIRNIDDYLGSPLICDKLPDGSHIKLPDNCKFGHPKFYKLREILHQHFINNDANSKVIIFCEYKDSVGEINASLLDQHLVKPKMFMGQSSITQKQQVNIIDSFRKGSFNTLISTCIGEEGIDVGFVDLVICFDISNKSSVRFIQRIGRTGRDRNGKVVMLVSEGREQQVLKECLVEKQHLCDTLVQARHIDDQLYKNDPRMIPNEITPECQELFIAPKTLKNLFTSKNSKSGAANDSDILDKSSILMEFTNLIPQPSLISVKNSENDPENNEYFKFNKNLEVQRISLEINIPTSKDSKILSDLMRQIEYSRFDIDLPENTEENKAENEGKRSTRVVQMKQADIRNMFRRRTEISENEDTENPNEFDVLFEAKLTNMLTELQDCGLCNKFEYIAPFKKELKPMTGNFNSVPYFDTESVSLFLNKLQEEDSYLCKENLSADSLLKADIFQTKQNSFDGNENISQLEAKSPEKCIVHNSSNVEKSPDLFDDDDDAFDKLIANFEFDVTSKESNTIEEKSMIQEKSVNQEKEDEIIEASPIIKRKAQQSHSDSFHRKRKRIKIDISDIVDMPPPSKSPKIPKSNRKCAKMTVGDIFGFDLSKTFNMSDKTMENDLGDIKTPQSHTKNTTQRNAEENKDLSDMFDDDNCFVPSVKSVDSCKDDKLVDFVSPSTIKAVRRPKKKLSTMDVWNSDYLNATFGGPKPKENKQIQKCVELSGNDLILEETSLNEMNFDIFDKSVPTKPSSSLKPQTPSLKARTLSLESDTEALKAEAPSLCCANSSTSSSSSLSSIENDLKPKISRKTKSHGKNFLDSEAEVSSDEVQSADEIINTQDDVYEESFVDDDNASVMPCTQTQAMYLQSVRSPACRPLVMRRPAARHVDDTVCDESIDLTQDAEDSFIHDSDDPTVLDDSSDELEIAERKLERIRKAKRVEVNFGKENERNIVKRKRIMRIESDSD